MVKQLRSARVVELSREEARDMLNSGELPKGHATLEELCTSSNTVYHIEGTPDYDFRIHRP